MDAPDAQHKISISVEYCAHCGFLLRTTWMVSEILREISDSVREVRLLPSGGGRFEWTVDDDLVYSKSASGRFPELSELKEAIYARLDTPPARKHGAPPLGGGSAPA